MGRTNLSYKVKRVNEIDGVRYSENASSLFIPSGKVFFASDKVQGLSELVGTELYVSDRVVKRLLNVDKSMIKEVKE
jgi:hypothetical protein